MIIKQYSLTVKNNKTQLGFFNLFKRENFDNYTRLSKIGASSVGFWNLSDINNREDMNGFNVSSFNLELIY